MIGIGERPKEWLDDDVKGWLTHYEPVDSITNDDAVERAVRWVQERMWVDRLEATVEAHTMTAARVREACSIPGTSVRTAFLCRDKPAMKQVLREAGVPCARSTGATSARGRPLVRVRGRLSADHQTARRSRRVRHPPCRRRRRPRTSDRRLGGRARRDRRRRGVHRGPRGLLRHDQRRTATWSTSSSATTTPTCSRRCGRGGSRRSSSPRIASTRSPTTTR